MSLVSLSRVIIRGCLAARPLVSMAGKFDARHAARYYMRFFLLFLLFFSGYSIRQEQIRTKDVGQQIELQGRTALATA